jgi:hypothetical protein
MRICASGSVVGEYYREAFPAPNFVPGSSPVPFPDAFSTNRNLNCWSILRSISG